jgi:archaeal flagellar protein FlaJ
MIADKRPQNNNILITLIISFIFGLIAFYAYQNWIVSVIALFIGAFIVNLSFYIGRRLKIYQDIRKMEDVFPDFIQLMSSNLRAGITIDRALLMSSRKEFSPLDVEIMRLGKDLVTGKEIDKALLEMGQRIKSEKINKTLSLIITGIRSGGNLAVLLEETAVNMRQRGFVEKRAASNVLMYAIFVFFAVAVGAPVLFGLSSVLVQVLTNLFASIPPIDSTQINMPLSLNKITISVSFVTYFSLVFILCTDVLASLVLGLVSKGEEKEGIKYILPLCVFSTSVFFAIKYFLYNYFSNFFG